MASATARNSKSSAPAPARGLVDHWRRLGSAWQWTLAGLAVFAAITLWRLAIIASPPFFDCACLLFTEANFLVESGFDYRRLRYDEAWVNDGGPFAYMISVLPTLIALVMQATSRPQTVFVVFHLFNFACAAIVVVAAYWLFSRRLPRPTSALLALVVLTTPIFCVQIDMHGMDLPMTAFAMLAIVAIVKDRFILAALAAAGAFFMKPTGALVGLSVLLYLGYCVTLGRAARDPRFLRRAYVGIAVNFAALVAEYALYHWSGLSNRLVRTPELSSFTNDWWICATDVYYISGVVAGALGVLALFCVPSVVATVKAIGWRRAVAAALAWPAREPIFIPALVLYAGMLYSMAYYIPVRCPRYFTLTVPTLYLLVAVCFARWLARPWAAVALAALAVFNFANLDGRFFPAVEKFPRHSRERSREYLADHNSVIAAMRAIEQQSQGLPIITGHPFAYYLALPRLGYVAKPLHGYSINWFTRPEFPNVTQLLTDRPREALFVWVDNLYYAIGDATIRRPKPGDAIVYDDQQPSPLVVYRRRIPGATADELDRWYVDNLFFVQPVVSPMLMLPARAGFLLRAGQGNWALYLLQKGTREDPDNLINWLELGRLDAARGDLTAATHDFRTVLEKDPDNFDAQRYLGLVYQHLKRSAEAAPLLERAAAQAPRDFESHLQAGLALLDAGVSDRPTLERADNYLRQAAQIDPKNPNPWLARARIAERHGDYAQAIDHAQRAFALARQGGNTRLADDIDARVRLYRQSRPTSASAAGADSPAR